MRIRVAKRRYRTSMGTRLILMLIAGLLAANWPARAQHMNEKDSPCASVIVTVELANCLSKARDVADSRLNGVYSKKNAKTSNGYERLSQKKRRSVKRR